MEKSSNWVTKAVSIAGQMQSTPSWLLEQSSRPKKHHHGRWTLGHSLIVSLLAVNALYLYLSTVFMTLTPSPPTAMFTHETGGMMRTRSIPANNPGSGSRHRGHGSVSSASSSASPREQLDFLEFSWDYHDDPVRAPAEMNSNDAYSGAWWQSTAQFVTYRVFDVEYGRTIVDTQEWASVDVFKHAQQDLTSTRDWLDLGVEHMSKWWKHLLHTKTKVGQQPQSQQLTRHSTIEGRITDIFRTYVHSHDRRIFFHALLSPQSSLVNDNSSSTDEYYTQSSQVEADLVTKSTLAVIPYTPDHTNVGVWSLAAMIISLVQTGMGRVVISLHPTHKREDMDLVRQVLDIVANATSQWGTNYNDHTPTDNHHTSPWTTFDICLSSDEAYQAWPEGTLGQWESNVPVAMLRELTRRVLGNKTTATATHDDDDDDDNLSTCWFGEDGSVTRWKYIYFSEPDLILVTRPDALPGLGRALRDGRLLAPHRLQPLPHASDFSGGGGGGMDDGSSSRILVNDDARVIPNVPPFEEVVEIDIFRNNRRNNHPLSVSSHQTVVNQFDSCCDRGTYKPYLVHKSCGNFWWLCGYSSSSSSSSNRELHEQPGIPRAMVTHKRLLGYPLMRLTRGTGVVFASSESGKTCRPQVGPCKRQKKNT